MKRRNFTNLFAGLSVVMSMLGTSAIASDMRIALVVKALGIGFFEAAAEGAEEAAAETGYNWGEDSAGGSGNGVPTYYGS